MNSSGVTSGRTLGSRIVRASKISVYFVGLFHEYQSIDDVGTHEIFMVPKSEPRPDVGPHR